MVMNLTESIDIIHFLKNHHPSSHDWLGGVQFISFTTRDFHPFKKPKKDQINEAFVGLGELKNPNLLVRAGTYFMVNMVMFHKN